MAAEDYSGPNCLVDKDGWPLDDLKNKPGLQRTKHLLDELIKAYQEGLMTAEEFVKVIQNIG